MDNEVIEVVEEGMMRGRKDIEKDKKRLKMLFLFAIMP